MSSIWLSLVVAAVAAPTVAVEAQAVTAVLLLAKQLVAAGLLNQSCHLLLAPHTR
jgi:hypothetical protein